MSLEHFKTQVLLLHSQQSTLDILSTGFSDRYAVHIATSGTEALNTLGVTPIHVIVSAQDLPGMSGLDAIREARKRSPDTIGILLAGTDAQDGLEALVGDQEVFQIVRGEISPDALVKLIDAATQRVRLMALSESANDLAANVDEPVAEHIVMETSENGSAIISDGTGQMPALKPQKIQIAPDAGGRSVDVLVLTKDEEFLSTIRDSARGLHNVYHANTPSQAEEIVRNNKVGVLVTDAAMVGSNIETITHRLRVVVQRMVAVVAGRRDDGELLMDLINRGQVYRFLLKPVSPGRARLAIEASVKHHLEADDSAFKPVDAKAPPAVAEPAKPPARRAAQKAAQQAAQKAAQQAVQKAAKPAPAPKAAPKAAPQGAPRRPAAAKKAAAPAKAQPKRVDPTIGTTPIDTSPIDDGLDDAFSDGGSFTETMTGIAATVGKSLASAKESIRKPADAPQASSVESSDGALAGILGNPKLLGIAAAFVIALGIGIWAFSGSDTDDAAAGGEAPDVADDGAAATIVESDIDFEPALNVDTVLQQPIYEDLLDEARIARNAGEIIGPPGSSAVELYVAAREVAPNDPVISAELDAVVEQVLGMAESAILDQRLQDADTALLMVALASPDNPRLGFLEAQLAQLQLRSAMDEARAAIRDGRFEDASAKISAASALAPAGSPEIQALTEELASASSEQQVDEVLALAAARLDNGRLTEPSNDNARYYYELALANDPQNAAARQGLVLIAGKLVLQARGAIDNGRFDDAETLLRDARALDPSSGDLAASSRALDNAREAQRVAAEQAEAERRRAVEAEAEAVRQAELARQAEAERVAEQQRQAEAERVAEQQRQAESRRAAAAAAAAASIVAASDATATGSSATGSAAPVANDASSTDAAATVANDSSPASSATTAGDNGASGAEADPQAAGSTAAATINTAAADTSGSNVAPDQSSSATDSGTSRNITTEPVWVGVSTLTRINYVAPRYPRVARRKNVTGSVDVSFVVTANGSVRDIEIMKSTPADTFDEAAIEAVTKWRFEPVIENGAAVEIRSAVRLSFDLQ